MPIVVFPDKILEIGYRQTQMLVEKGLVRPRPGSSEFDGQDSKAALIAMIESPATMTCDFCGGTPVTMEFPAEDFIAMETPRETSESLGAWMACTECAPLIEGAWLDDLLERAIAKYNAAHPDEVSPKTQVALDIMLRGLYQSFFDHRIGPGRRI